MSADSLDYPLHHGAPGELGLGLRDRQRYERDRLRDEVLLRRPGRGFPSRRPSIGGVSVSASLMATGSVAGGQAGGGPELVVKALLEFAEPTSERQLVRAVAVPWFEIAERMSRDPQWMYQIEPRAWEEIIAGAYEREGFDEVISRRGAPI